MCPITLQYSLVASLLLFLIQQISLFKLYTYFHAKYKYIGIISKQLKPAGCLHVDIPNTSEVKTVHTAPYNTTIILHPIIYFI